MTARWFGLSIVLAVAACGSDSPPVRGITSPGNVTLQQARIATTHLFGDTPDKTAIFGPVISVVGPGVELRNFGATVFVNGQPTSGIVDIDFSATNIRITLTRDQPAGFFDVLRFSDADGTIPAFADVRLNPTTSYPGFTASRVRTEPDTIDVNLTGLHGSRGQEVSLDLRLTGESPSASGAAWPRFQVTAARGFVVADAVRIREEMHRAAEKIHPFGRQREHLGAAKTVNVYF